MVTHVTCVSKGLIDCDRSKEELNPRGAVLLGHHALSEANMFEEQKSKAIESFVFVYLFVDCAGFI